MASAQRFTAVLTGTERGGGGHLVEVPEDVVQALGGKGRIPVDATFGGIPYRGSIVRMGGTSVLGVLKGIIEQLGVDAGDPLEVTVELDTRERTVEPPAELAAAIKSEPQLGAAWTALSFTARKELARSIEEARKPETRARRVEKALEQLRTKAPRT
jgi:hypothetical protein